VDRAVRAGAKFIVTPGYNPKVVNYCIDNSVPVVPGVMDTNSIEMALEAGLDTVKFFPAEQAGGVKMLKALSGPYTKLKFIPTGGINKDNMNEYLSFNKIAAVGGSWMVKKDMIAKGEFKKIEELSREAIDKMLGMKVRLSDLSGYQKDGSLTVYTANKKRADYYLGKEGINPEHINIVEE
jgi:2-dehydro-3-deoxyphosphogluconate aldolase/(4S)-4-hydroxy-2-oxoglutarate aldolase